MMKACGFKLPLQRSGAEPALCGSGSGDDLRQQAVHWGRAVPNVQIVQLLRFVQAVQPDSSRSTVQSFNEKEKLPRFENSRNVEMIDHQNRLQA
jgi:hypothetical protein